MCSKLAGLPNYQTKDVCSVRGYFQNPLGSSLKLYLIKVPGDKANT